MSHELPSELVATFRRAERDGRNGNVTCYQLVSIKLQYRVVRSVAVVPSGGGGIACLGTVVVNSRFVAR